MPQLSTPWQWQFPAIAKPPLLSSQLLKVRSEAWEADNADLDEEGNQRIAEELMDTIHAAETALRLLPFNEMELDAIKRGVIEKNDARGYYGGGQ